MQFDREMRRRAFWASWCTHCLNGNQVDSSRVYDGAALLPLPASFGKGGSIAGVQLMHVGRMDPKWHFIVDSAPNPQLNFSLMAELVKLSGVWSVSQSLVTIGRAKFQKG
jgi:hypothetical protein